MIGGRNMLGAGVDPNAFKYDFSGAYEIGKAYAKGIENTGEGIAKGIQSAADFFVKRKEKQKEDAQIIDTVSRIAGVLETKAPDVLPGAGDLKMQLDDQEIPQSKRAELARSGLYTIKLGNEIQQLLNQNAMMNLRQQKFTASQGGGGGGGAKPTASSNGGFNPFE
jgi:hypothetical protein